MEARILERRRFRAMRYDLRERFPRADLADAAAQASALAQRDEHAGRLLRRRVRRQILERFAAFDTCMQGFPRDFQKEFLIETTGREHPVVCLSPRPTARCAGAVPERGN